jgi:hypothetical protein
MRISTLMVYDYGALQIVSVHGREDLLRVDVEQSINKDDYLTRKAHDTNRNGNTLLFDFTDDLSGQCTWTIRVGCEAVAF